MDPLLDTIAAARRLSAASKDFDTNTGEARIAAHDRCQKAKRETIAAAGTIPATWQDLELEGTGIEVTCSTVAPLYTIRVDDQIVLTVKGEGPAILATALLAAAVRVAEGSEG